MDTHAHYPLSMQRRRRLGRRQRFVILVSCLACLFFFFFSPRQPTTTTTDTDPEDESAEESISYYPSYRPSDSALRPPPRILLVSAFYPSKDDYIPWLKRFLGQISTDVYFFTSPELESLVRSMRPALFPLSLNTSFPTPLSIPPLQNLSDVYSTQQHTLDPEKWRHSPDVYAIWNAKPYFVTQAVQNLERQGKVYDYVFWNDAGSFRDEHWYSMWPDPRRVEQVWTDAAVRLKGQSSATDLVFFPIGGLPRLAHREWKEYHGPLNAEFSEGSFFGGTPSAMNWFSHTFYAYHHHYLSRYFFIGKGQSIFNSLFLLFPERFMTMYFGDVPGMDIELFGGCCWRWWYYHFWLGDEEGGERVREMWRRMLEDIKKGRGRLNTFKAKWEAWVVWWRGEVEVPSRKRMARVVLMKRLLRRRFGRTWTPPERYVQVSSDL